MRQIFLYLFLGFIGFSCHQSSDVEVMHDMVAAEKEIPIARQQPNTPEPTKVQEDIGLQKKIIKDGRIGLQVTDLEKTKLHVDTLIKRHNGYYANESFNNTNWESSYNLKIRIPGANFELFLSELETGEGELLYKEIDARDVTEQFIDLETRLENKRNYIKRYNDLLKRANSIKEILEIEEKIRRLEEEVESTTGKLRYLTDQVAFSTLDLTISKRKEYNYNPVQRDKFGERFKQSVSKGWYVFVDLLLLLFKIWPFWLILALTWYLWRRNRKSKGKK